MIIRHGVVHNGPLQTVKVGRSKLHAVSRYNSLVAANEKHPDGRFTIGIERNCAGIGDMLMLTPSFKEIKKCYPNSHLSLITSYTFSNGVLLDIVKDNPYLDEVTNFMRGNKPTHYDFYRNVSPGWLHIERPGQPIINRIDLFANDLGIIIEDHHPDYFVNADESLWASKFITTRTGYDSNQIFKIGIQLKSAALRRSWTLTRIKELINIALQQYPNWHFFIFDHDTKENFNYSNVYNLQGQSFRNQAAILQQMNLFVGIDSGMTHLAGALDIPIIAIFGSTPPDSRLNYYNAIPVQNTQLSCLGCWYQPCNINYKCMSGVTGQQVFNKISEFYKKDDNNIISLDTTPILNKVLYAQQTINHHYDYDCIISMACYNQLEATKQCINSLIQTNSIQNNLLVLIDNASTDQTLSYFNQLYEQYPNNIRIIHNDQNLGFGEPHNKAFQQFGHLGKYFTIINNDIILPSNWLNNMKRTFDNNTAIVGVNNTCGSLHQDGGGYEGTTLEYIEASCLMMPTQLIKQYGLFDTKTFPFAYNEDADLSLRYRRLKFNIKRAPVFITHNRSLTANTIPNINEIRRMNNKTFYKKWQHYLHTKSFEEKILIKRNASLGDVYLITPVINALKKENPNLKIDILTKVPQLFRNNSNIETVLTNEHAIKHNEYMNIIDLNDSYEKEPYKNILSVYAEKCGIDIQKCKDFFLFKEEYTCFDNQDYIVIHPGKTNWIGRNWYPDRFNQVAKYLQKQKYKVVLIGDNATPKLGNIDLDLRNKLSIYQLADIISKAKLFIGIDSFPFHIAQGENIPGIVIFGCILPQYRIIRDNIIGINDTKLNCIGCHHSQPIPAYSITNCIEGNESCMKNITVNIVNNKIKTLLENN